MLTIAELRTGRKARGLSQKDLAKVAGISLSAVNAYEQGARNLTATASSKIEAVFKRMPTLDVEPQRTQIADLSDPNTILVCDGTILRAPEIELIQVIAKTLIGQRM